MHALQRGGGMSVVSLVEIFKSIQGEGYHAGRPAIFVRTAGCNLSCVFAEGSVCDTPYQQANMKLPVERVIIEAAALAGESLRPWMNRDNRPMLILTGGEPTMAPAFDELVEAADAAGFYVAVETNGTKWREGLLGCDWICVSPKYSITQGSPAEYHNHNPQDPTVHAQVIRLMEETCDEPLGEFRHVITSKDAPMPPYVAAFRHYVSPAVISDGLGTEWKTGKFPGFVPGAMERCQQIVWEDPRWRISAQQHKWWGVR
jgi:organic radical activating enzyme